MTDLEHYLRGLTFDAEPFGNPNFRTLVDGATESCNGSDFNVFNGSATDNVLYEFSYPATQAGNDSTYELALRTSTPVWLAAWPRNRTRVWYGDVRSVCLTPAGGVKAGSEPATNGAMHVDSALSGSAMLLVAAWIAVVSLL